MKKTSTLLIFLGISIAINIFTVIEIIKYEPDTYKYRFYNNLRAKGYFMKDESLSILKSPQTMISLDLGQSQASNSSSSKYDPHNPVYNYYNGHLYKVHEPLIGAGGNGGAVWPLLADKLIDSGIYKKAIIISLAVGNTTVQDWASGEYHKKLVATLADLKKRNIHLTYIFWHQGEENNGTSKTIYKQNLSVVLSTFRKYGQDAPFFCSIVSYSPSATNMPLGVDKNLEDAQREFITENKNVLKGPNTDSLIYAIHRYDSWHFSDFGKKQYANLWMEAIKEKKEQP